ncbi:hypothetical protein J6590_002043 [Homalodisca vitripennis]|nr:hypothetical protein J6590_002043 [Homalodisca vitripennis]
MLPVDTDRVRLSVGFTSDDYGITKVMAVPAAGDVATVARDLLHVLHAGCADMFLHTHQTVIPGSQNMTDQLFKIGPPCFIQLEALFDHLR